MSTSPREPRRWWILAVLCLALLVLVIDNSVLNVAIPTLISDLGASSSDIQWMIDAYILVFAGLLLTAGSLSDRYGRRRALVIGIVIFGVASLAAAFAQSPVQLIAARAAMGAGGAFLMPGTLSILTTVFDDAERKKAIAVWSSVLMLGALGGPTVGGLMLEHFWWGSVFLLNVPVAALGILAALLIIPESRGPARRTDLIGALLSMVALTGVVWGIIEASRDGWGSGPVLAAFAIGLAGAVAFVLWERRVAEPMLPLGLFRDRNFSGASLSLVLLAFAGGGILLALTQYLQFVLGFSPLKAGLAFAPMIAAVMVFNGVGVVVDKRFGARAAIVTGLVLLGTGFGLLASTSVGDGYGHLVLALVVTGAGSGTAGPAAVATLLAALPKDRAGVGSAVNDTVQQVGQALSVAVLGTVLTSAFAAKMPASAPAEAKHSIGDALALASTTGDAGLVRVAREAFVGAMSITSWVGVFGAVGAVLVVLLVIRRAKPTTAGPVEDRPATDEVRVSS
ncbi:EmrB/QacA subfamily drug resistance transporter [Asanoa ferruginea]|uniref:EmrB/QacA subfamily drug resistance transporter n=1 Tax=Asanoa ferruginea TaxID=53367 RepID=A0A3D9ZCE0_9ACTN|nr:MFS transporter [Asanoa ferruginea]REF94927.1 EmrB/QacA subfamily drug resistance transporter [Asanoa ferruginea]GIF45493.1 MFS transporter [Asanoa ferruginea]